ncbi:MAG: nucleoside hydrolase-like domain-containing protein [Coraliomargaritaceae bacterium]
MKQTRIYRIIQKCLFILITSASCLSAGTEKPNIWVYSDLTDPRDQREGGHPKGDPDDLVSLASLLLSANRFHIESIVLGSGSFADILNPVELIEEIFVPAYEDHVAHLKEENSGYQQSIHFQWSSVTRNSGWPRIFKEDRDYRDLNDYETVQGLAEYAKDHEVYVLVWGALTEPAILVKHLLHTGQEAVLKNITIITHWSQSFVRSMHPEALKTDPHMVTNCKMDRKACLYLHQQAKDGRVKMIQLGCVGQSGIVDGSANYPRIEEFDQSRLGQIFISGKYNKNRADQSDASTYWLLASDLHFNLNDYPNDGSLTKEIEERNIVRFQQRAPSIMDNLLVRSNASNGTPYPASLIAEYFCYAYYRWGHYCIYAPNPVPFRILSPEGTLEKEGTLKRWDNSIDLPKKEQGYYTVELLFPDRTVRKPL